MAFAVRRAGEHVGRLALIALLVALLVAALGGLDALADRMISEGAAQMLADAEPDARSVRVVADQAEDAEAQDAAVRDAISSAFSGADVVVSRRVAATMPVTTDAGQTFRLGLLDDERAPDLATLEEGTWPASDTQIALAGAAADRQGLAIGSKVTMFDPLTPDEDGIALTVVGIWTPDDPADAAWQGDPSVVSGESDGATGPAVIAAGALDDLPDPPVVTWEVAPAGVGLADLAALQSGVRALRGVPDAVDPEHDHAMDVGGASAPPCSGRRSPSQAPVGCWSLRSSPSRCSACSCSPSCWPHSPPPAGRSSCC
ncbi:hypothetical protein L2X99_04305 [Microbacterium sp. KUDC0406]|uniref:hypothetical protein n=1 Tax=Microbacterium sp. KUDC0406 TaxID=2909588 RepID=UPI001F2E2617|nr:hypothetical protein [Microbacterium sp. KUDC0406]UJP10861.1 hypothetical protein L2X99_04305 [Microbacterium sp. KUDC0406]